jgi:hypothetical protein
LNHIRCGCGLPCGARCPSVPDSAFHILLQSIPGEIHVLVLWCFVDGLDVCPLNGLIFSNSETSAHSNTISSMRIVPGYGKLCSERTLFVLHIPDIRETEKTKNIRPLCIQLRRNVHGQMGIARIAPDHAPSFITACDTECQPTQITSQVNSIARRRRQSDARQMSCSGHRCVVTRIGAHVHLCGFVPLLSISVWCLCGWPLEALPFLACAVCGCSFSLFRLVCAPVWLLLPPLSSASACVAGSALFPACASRFPASFPPPSFVSPLRVFVTCSCTRGLHCSVFSRGCPPELRITEYGEQIVVWEAASNQGPSGA